MLLRFALCFAAAAAMLAVAAPLPSWAQTSPPAAPAPAKPPEAAPPPAAAPPAAKSDQNTEPSDVFGAETTLAAKPVVYVKGTGTWDNAFDTVTSSFKKLRAYIDKEGLKADGLPMTIFTATDDSGFQYEAAIPLAEAPKNPPHGEISTGQSPEGAALKFVHRGSYDALDNTYEAITNYLDEKRLEAKDLFIEEYVTDPVSTDQDKLVVNVYVLTK